MDLGEEICFEYLPSEEELEKALKGNKAKINLSNTKKPCFASEIEYLFGFSEHINGLNISLDTGDYHDLGNLAAFENLSYLRLRFETDNLTVDDVSYFLDWMSELNKLEAVCVENLPLNYFDILHAMSIYLALEKKFPVYLFIKNKKRSMKKLDIRIPPISLLSAFFVKRMFLDEANVESESNKIFNRINEIDHSEFQYYGDVYPDNPSLSLCVESLNLNVREEIVVTFSGRSKVNNVIGSFSCEARCLWREEEGSVYLSTESEVNYDNGVIKSDHCKVIIRSAAIGKDGMLEIDGTWISSNINTRFNGDLSRTKDKRFYDRVKKDLSIVKADRPKGKDKIFVFTV